MAVNRGLSSYTGPSPEGHRPVWDTTVPPAGHHSQTGTLSPSPGLYPGRKWHTLCSPHCLISMDTTSGAGGLVVWGPGDNTLDLATHPGLWFPRVRTGENPDSKGSRCLGRQPHLPQQPSPNPLHLTPRVTGSSLPHSNPRQLTWDKAPP